MTIEEAKQVLPTAADRQGMERALKDFRVAALKVFGLESWRQKASVCIVIQDDGQMLFEPRLRWDEPVGHTGAGRGYV
ncbi:MAG TPA: hypothetical protein VH640_10080 [Bryobacteraceae bacterium]|jgi:hypothetical protein